MAGTVIGGKAAAATNKAKYGEDFYRIQGALGGAVRGTRKGFAAATIEERAEWGRKGGTNSRRTGIKDGDGTSRSAIKVYRDNTDPPIKNYVIKKKVTLPGPMGPYEPPKKLPRKSDGSIQPVNAPKERVPYNKLVEAVGLDYETPERKSFWRRWFRP